MLHTCSAVVAVLIALGVGIIVIADGNAKPSVHELEEKDEIRLTALKFMGTATVEKMLESRMASPVSSEARNVYLLFSVIPQFLCPDYTFPCANSTELNVIQSTKTKFVAEAHIVTNEVLSEFCSDEANRGKFFFTWFTEDIEVPKNAAKIEKVELWFKCGLFQAYDLEEIVGERTQDSEIGFLPLCGLTFIIVGALITVVVHLCRSCSKGTKRVNVPISANNGEEIPMGEFEPANQDDALLGNDEKPPGADETADISDEPNTVSTTADSDSEPAEEDQLSG